MKNSTQINWKNIFIGAIILLVLLLLGGLFLFRQTTLAPSEKALEALQSDDRVAVLQEDSFIAFEPTEEMSSTGFIFYPGALVDIRSYAPILREVAARGYLTVIPSMPLNLAFFNTDAAEQVMMNYPEINHWVIGGHSLGGVAAANFAVQQASVDGIIFLASYPANDLLKEADIPVMSIYGSADGLTTLQDIEDSRTLVPAEAQFVEIKGGNHAQFGAYGPQNGDNKATISAEEQWSQTVNAIVTMLEMISEN